MDGFNNGQNGSEWMIQKEVPYMALKEKKHFTMFFRFLLNTDSLVNPTMECGCRNIEDPGDNPVILVLVKEPHS
jgi:hypothetical protein